MALSQETMDHLHHMKYPASGKDLKEQCDSWSDVPENERMVADKLDPEKMYNSVDEVMADVGGGMEEAAGSEHQM